MFVTSKFFDENGYPAERMRVAVIYTCNMNRKLLPVSLLAAALACLACDSVHGATEITGCVQPGVEAGCVVLITSDHQTYLLLGSNRPTSGQVRARGKVVNVASTCMQGTPFQVSSFDVLSSTCAP